MFIKDEIVEKFIKLHLSPASWNILWFILCNENVTSEQISKTFGINRNKIKELLNNLSNRNIILLNTSDTISLNEQIDKWQLQEGCFRNKRVNEYKITEGFQRFATIYPKKLRILDALKEWNKLKPDEKLENQILSAIEKFKESEEWMKDGGKYIPLPVNFLAGKRWLDKLTYQDDWRET